MQIGPIFRALMRNKLGVLLIAVQIAFTMTVLVNALFIISQRAENMTRPSGLDEANTFHISSIGYGSDFNESVVMDDDLSRIRQLPGVIDASVVNAIPVSSSGSSSGFMTEAGRREMMVPAALYRTDANVFSTMDLQVIAGEPFSDDQVVRRASNEDRDVPGVVLTLAMAEALFPDDAMSTVGKIIYAVDDTPLRVIGLVDRLQAPWPNSTFIEQSVLYPEVIIDGSSNYMIRTEPGFRDEIMVQVEELLAASGHQRIVRNNQSFEYTRNESYRIDNLMTSILKVVIATLMFITSLGIVGLAVFSINRRRKQIGTRRALGATRPAILGYFLVENALISGIGVAVGAALTIAFNMFLVQTFNMPRIDWYYTPLGMLALIILGQLAVIGPARNASMITPALATRSV